MSLPIYSKGRQTSSYNIIYVPGGPADLETLSSDTRQIMHTTLQHNLAL